MLTPQAGVLAPSAYVENPAGFSGRRGKADCRADNLSAAFTMSSVDFNHIASTHGRAAMVR
jgi:hypothetical protein